MPSQNTNEVHDTDATFSIPDVLQSLAIAVGLVSAAVVFVNLLLLTVTPV
jgi:hypothetical protein